MRLTNHMRCCIINRILSYAFDARRAAINNEKPQLFNRALIDVFGPETMARISELPAWWFKECRDITLNAGGWRYTLRIDNDFVRVPARTADDQDWSYVPLALRDEALIDDLRNHATREDAWREELKNMKHALHSLLASCTTLATFLDVMPEADEWIADLILTPAKPTALALSGREIARMVLHQRAVVGETGA